MSFTTNLGITFRIWNHEWVSRGSIRLDNLGYLPETIFPCRHFSSNRSCLFVGIVQLKRIRWSSIFLSEIVNEINANLQRIEDDLVLEFLDKETLLKHVEELILGKNTLTVKCSCPQSATERTVCIPNTIVFHQLLKWKINRRGGINQQQKNTNRFLEFWSSSRMIVSNLVIHEFSTVSLLNPSISGRDRILLSTFVRKTWEWMEATYEAI